VLIAKHKKIIKTFVIKKNEFYQNKKSLNMTKGESIIKLEEQRLKLQTEQAKNFSKIIEKDLPLIEKYFTAKIEKLEAPRFRWMFIIFGAILFISIGLTGFLTFYDKISSENFTFLLGILIGSIITLIGDVIINMGNN